MENDSKRASKISTDKGADVNGENPDAVNGVIVLDDDVEEQQKLDAQENGSEQVEEEEEEEETQPQQPSSTRTPFTDLSQVDADAALARTLQEQERAYMMLRMNTEGSDYGSWEEGSYLHDEEDDFGDPNDESDVDAETEEAYDGTDIDDEEDAFDVHARAEDGDNPPVEYDPEVFSSDEAYARALQDAEEREMAARMLALAGISEVLTAGEVQEMEEHPLDLQLQDRWEEVDTDELSYEELLALGEVVGSESRGLSTDTISSLPSVQYKTGSSQHGSSDSCVICRLDYEEEETLTVLSCKHSYHSECINNWLQINKVCPVCSAEVVTGGNSNS